MVQEELTELGECSSIYTQRRSGLLDSHWLIFTSRNVTPFSTNHVREWFSGGTGSSAYPFRRNPECFPLLFVFIRLNRDIIYKFIRIVNVNSFYSVLGYAQWRF